MSELLSSLREIKMFIAAYEERSFTAAALREHATQSGVSQHIRHIEDRLGAQLFNRSNAMEPTAVGDAYYARCLEVVRAHTGAHCAMRRFATGLAGDASIGLPPALANCQLAPAYQRFEIANPNATLRLVEAHDSALTNRVISGELDCAIVPASPRPVRNLASSLFCSVPAFLLSSLASPLKHLQPVRLAEVGDLKLIMPNAFTHPSVIDAYLTANQIVAPRFELDGVLGTLDLVSVSNWKAVMPATLLAHLLMAPPSEREFTVNPLCDPALSVDMLLVHAEREVLSDVSRAFLAILHEVISEHQRAIEALIAV